MPCLKPSSAMDLCLEIGGIWMRASICIPLRFARLCDPVGRVDGSICMLRIVLFKLLIHRHSIYFPSRSWEHHRGRRALGMLTFRIFRYLTFNWRLHEKVKLEFTPYLDLFLISRLFDLRLMGHWAYCSSGLRSCRRLTLIWLRAL